MLQYQINHLDLDLEPACRYGQSQLAVVVSSVDDVDGSDHCQTQHNWYLSVVSWNTSLWQCAVIAAVLKDFVLRHISIKYYTLGLSLPQRMTLYEKASPSPAISVMLAPSPPHSHELCPISIPSTWGSSHPTPSHISFFPIPTPTHHHDVCFRFSSP